MRAIPAVLVALAALGLGCTESSLGSDTAYRRLLDRYDSEAACLASSLDACYQTLTLCANGAATIDLESRPLRGSYTMVDEIAQAKMVETQFEFNLDTRTSPQLPGRHPWEQVSVLQYDCAAQ